MLLSALGLRCCAGFSLIEVNRGYSPDVVSGLLMVAVSLVAEHGPWGPRASVAAACGLSSCGSWALEHRVSSYDTQA